MTVKYSRLHFYRFDGYLLPTTFIAAENHYNEKIRVVDFVLLLLLRCCCISRLTTSLSASAIQPFTKLLEPISLNESAVNNTF